jgi:hypothetical protein
MQAMVHAFLQEGESFLDIFVLTVLHFFFWLYVLMQCWFFLQHWLQWQQRWCGVWARKPRQFCYTNSLVLVDSPNYIAVYHGVHVKPCKKMMRFG